MLVELRLKNYAVIDNVAVEFAPGLNLLTGETGAGKSILIDALALLLGEKASSDVIRTGAERAVVSAVFECEGPAADSVDNVLEHEVAVALVETELVQPGGAARGAGGAGAAHAAFVFAGERRHAAAHT